MDKLQPTATGADIQPVPDYNSDTSQRLNVYVAPNIQSATIIPMLTAIGELRMPQATPCPVPVTASQQHSPDFDSASQTSSSINSGSPLSTGIAHTEHAEGPTSSSALVRIPEAVKESRAELKSSVRNYQNLKTEASEGEIAENASFRSFAEFERAFNQWKAIYMHPFRVASSGQLRNADGTVDEVFKYKYIVYRCAHYGKPRMRGAGKRPNQNYLPCGCMAMLRLNYAYNTGLRITTLKDKHTGHEISPENYAKSCSKIRRVSSPKRFREKSPGIRRTQQHGPIRGIKYENSNGTVLSHIQEASAPETPSTLAASAPTPSDTPLSLLARNVVQMGKTPEEDGTNLMPLTGFQHCQPPFTNGIQNLTAATAAAGRQQQQQMAAALLSHQKENMGFPFPNSSVLQQIQSTNMAPSIIPLIRGALGLPALPTSISFSFQEQIASAPHCSQVTSNSSTQLLGPKSPATASSSNLLSATQSLQQPSTFAQLLELQQQQYFQQQNLAAAFSLVQTLRAPLFSSTAVTQPSIMQISQSDSPMIPGTSAGASESAANNVQPSSTPMDLSVTPNGINQAGATEESDKFIQSLPSLQSQKNHLGAEKYNKKIGNVRQYIMLVFPNWNPEVTLNS